METYLVQISGGAGMPRWQYTFSDFDDASALKHLTQIVEGGNVPPNTHTVYLWRGVDQNATLVAEINPRIRAEVKLPKAVRS